MAACSRVFTVTFVCAALLMGCVSSSISTIGGKPFAVRTAHIKERKSIPLPATLFLPPGTGKVPAMIIVHGSDGATRQREGRYARALQKMGVAALVIDSFSARGISRTVEDQSQISSLQMTVDAYLAAVKLRSHPRIRADRVGVMGFSKGGSVALYASTQPFLARLKRRVPSVRPFALHVAFYPWCGNFWHDTTMTGPPLYVLIGSADNYTGVQPCLEWVQRYKASGGNIAGVVYPGAGHGWDGTTTWRAARAQVFRNCIFAQQANGSWIERTSGIRFIDPNGRRDRAAYTKAIDTCRSTGASGGLHAPTRTRSLVDLKSYVRRHLLR